MLKPINSIIKDSIGNIMFRGNVVTGIVATDNGDGSYDVFISESDRAYPKIFTLSRNPDLAIGDKVRILYKNGCKELPIILPPVKPTGAKNIYVVYKKNSDNKYYLIQINNDDSITEIAELAELYGHNLVRILTDNNGNVYALREIEATYTYTWYKYNNSGVLQTSKVMGANEMFGFITSNYLYTMKFNGDDIYKRNLSNLETAETINLTSGHRYYYLCFDSSGYLYTYDRDYAGGAAFVKWELGSAVLDSHTQGLSSLSTRADFVPISTIIAGDAWIGYMGTLNMNLDSDLAYWAVDDINAQVCGVASNGTYWYIIGENAADNKLIVKKYNSTKALQSTIEISTDYIGGSYRRFHNAITAYPF